MTDLNVRLVFSGMYRVIAAKSDRVAEATEAARYGKAYSTVFVLIATSSLL
jgi:hypothetical protein